MAAPKGTDPSAGHDYETGRKARETMLDAHDKERHDMHTGHKTAIREMAKRHEEAIKALHDGEMKRLNGGGSKKRSPLYTHKRSQPDG